MCLCREDPQAPRGCGGAAVRGAGGGGGLVLHFPGCVRVGRRLHVALARRNPGPPGRHRVPSHALRRPAAPAPREAGAPELYGRLLTCRLTCLQARHGGRFEHYFDASVVTHVIAEDLAHTHLIRCVCCSCPAGSRRQGGRRRVDATRAAGGALAHACLDVPDLGAWRVARD